MPDTQTMERTLAISHTGFRSIVFDCDSTLVRIEGIDELAGERIDEIRRLTDLAMEGKIPLEEVYGRRLELIQPTRARVEDLGRLYVASLVADARETVSALLWLGKAVRIVSGGLRPPVEVLARELGVPAESVAAVGIDFTLGGAYAGFDASSPLARQGGKLDVVRDWNLSRPSMLVGDGATDLEARDAVDSFAAYMGVAFRQPVAARADVVLQAESLAPILALSADPADRDRLESSRWVDLLARGDALLAG